MARLAALALIAFLVGCGGDDPTDVGVTFYVTGSDLNEGHEISCDPPAGSAADPAAVCEELAANDDLYFPEDGEECPLPVPITYLDVTGTHDGNELSQQMTPCSEAKGRAVDAWVALLGFEPPPFERR